MTWAGKLTSEIQWGRGVEKIDPNLILLADALIIEGRRFTGNQKVELHINVAWDDSGHVTDSQHYMGKAFDGYLKADGKALPLEIQALCAFKIPFTGIGLYVDWNTPGIHCDTRVLGPLEPEKIWIRKDGQYLDFNSTTWTLVKEISNGTKV